MEGFVLDRTTINMVEVADKEVKFFHLQLLDKGLELKLTAPQSLFVRADEEMIRIVLRNLLSNAIKFAPGGTTVQLRISRNDQNKVFVNVTNFGDPISPDLINKLFSYQMSPTVDSKGERGTGLGLAMTAFFVRLNGGDISLVPSMEGTITFCIEIPEAIEQSMIP
jgi:signal transduction histidine kinase